MTVHRMCRPPKGAADVERWTGRAWVPDDGKPGLAFSYRDPQSFPAAGTTYCTNACMRSAKPCVSRRAMDRTCARWHCANGRNLRALPVKRTTPKEKNDAPSEK